MTLYKPDCVSKYYEFAWKIACVCSLFAVLCVFSIANYAKQFAIVAFEKIYSILCSVNESSIECIVMPRCACASEVYGSVCMCVCVCVRVCRVLQLLKDQSDQYLVVSSALEH